MVGPQAINLERMRKPPRGFISRERRFRQVVSDFKWNHSGVSGCILGEEVEFGLRRVEQEIVVFHVGTLGAFVGVADTEHHGGDLVGHDLDSTRSAVRRALT